MKMFVVYNKKTNFAPVNNLKDINTTMNHAQFFSFYFYYFTSKQK